MSTSISMSRFPKTIPGKNRLAFTSEEKIDEPLRQFPIPWSRRPPPPGSGWVDDLRLLAATCTLSFAAMRIGGEDEARIHFTPADVVQGLANILGVDEFWS